MGVSLTKSDKSSRGSPIYGTPHMGGSANRIPRHLMITIFSFKCCFLVVNPMVNLQKSSTFRDTKRPGATARCRNLTYPDTTKKHDATIC